MKEQLVLALGLLAAPLAAQSATAVQSSSAISAADSAQLSLAEQVIRAANAVDAARASALRSYPQSFEQSFRASVGESFSEQHRRIMQAGLDAGLAEFTHQFDTAIAGAMLREMASNYASHFSADELIQMQAFYQTPQAQNFTHARVMSDRAALSQAGADPIVLAYSASATGQKEAAFTQEMTTIMMQFIMRAMADVLPVVNAKVISAIQAKMPGEGR